MPKRSLGGIINDILNSPGWEFPHRRTLYDQGHRVTGNGSNHTKHLPSRPCGSHCIKKKNSKVWVSMHIYYILSFGWEVQ